MLLFNTAIHAALGESGPLDYAMLERAVDQGVPEGDQLDWKSVPYDQAKAKKDDGKKKDEKDPGDEFAKDIASMANLRGGLLVIGISENRRTSRATGFNPIELSDGLERQMRAWLSTRVDPPIAGVEFHSLHKDAADDRGVLVVNVPASPDTPHMVGKPETPCWPYRDGTQTKWMKERDIERAYRDRFDRERSDQEAMVALIEQASDYLDLEAEAWLVGVARPTVPVPTNMKPPTKSQVEEVIKSASGRFFVYWSEIEQRLDQSAIRRLGEGLHNPRVGLRRWVFGRVFAGPGAPHDKTYVELLHDGSVLIAGAAGGHGRIAGKHEISDHGVHSVIVDLVSLISATAEKRGLTGSNLVRLDLLRPDSLPFGFTTPERHGSHLGPWDQPPWSRDVRRFIPVETTLPPLVDAAACKQAAHGLAEDVLAQFGLTPKDIGWRKPPDETATGDEAR